MTDNKLLEGIINMVVSPVDEGNSEVFIATEDGQFAKFQLRNGEMLMDKLSLTDYIHKTQHYLTSKNIKAYHGSRKS